ncbi:hypothetical protein CMUS01_13569 [Colletotrichum musicola]|uniref:Subtilisin-like serine protease n=1 Tax=Colletotrichum musicola TaxID=2175873 RepID=A0A8H6JCF0_9PEZI|nr:hypothetical protein CMUS01_13569 [Colletotrichum musicola]
MLKIISQEPPFAKEDQLCTELDTLHKARPPANPDDARPGRRGPRLPGYPRISLSHPTNVLSFLETEHCTPDLDRASPKLWWLSTQNSGNISPLHRQRVKGRDVVLTEEARLHLVWLRGRIFVKPVSRYLASHSFWRRYLSGPAGGADDDDRRVRVRKAALGFLRTYVHLIRYESDFHIARDLRLVPQDWTWEAFSDFTESLPRVSDGDVSPRYAYGELRLARLNLYAPLLFNRSSFQRVEHHSDAAAYVARFYGPVLFVVGVASVVLSGLQVAVAVEGAGALQAAALWFSVLVILGSCLVVLVLAAMIAWKVGREWKFALRNRERRPEEGQPLAGAGKT